MMRISRPTCRCVVQYKCSMIALISIILCCAVIQNLCKIVFLKKIIFKNELRWGGCVKAGSILPELILNNLRSLNAKTLSTTTVIKLLSDRKWLFLQKLRRQLDLVVRESSVLAVWRPSLSPSWIYSSGVHGFNNLELTVKPPSATTSHKWPPLIRDYSSKWPPCQNTNILPIKAL